MNKCYIYCLIDPARGGIRYVGKTNLNPPELRLVEHLELSLYAELNWHLHRWLRRMVDSGALPEFAILEECEESNWRECERFWIKVCREQGYILTNMTKGGDGGWPWLDPQYRRNMSDRMTYLSTIFWADDSYRSMHANIRKQLWSDPVYAEKVSKARTDYFNRLWSDPDFRLRKSKSSSEQMTNQWADDSYRNRMIELRGPPEYSAILSDNAMKQWQNLEIRARTCESMSKYHREKSSTEEGRLYMVKLNRRANHIRWHERRGITNPNCQFCLVE